MQSLQITAELFYLPQPDRTMVLYAPLLGFACHGNAALVRLLEDVSRGSRDFSPEEGRIIDYFIARRVINGTELEQVEEAENDDFAPASLTLFPTSRCQMRCRYCYAERERPAALDMALETALSAIDFFIDTRVKNGQNTFPIEFHGSGEPFAAWPLMHAATAYARKQCTRHGLEPVITAGTNGLLTRRQQQWAVANLTAMTISFEGLEEVQNHQRPLANGRPSFSRVDQTLRFLDAQHFPYALRTTVTAMNQPRLIETLDTICRRYRCRTWIVEPMQGCRAAAGNPGPGRVDMALFAGQIIQLEETGRSKGIRVIYSGAQLERRARTFCHLGRAEMAVTPDGRLTGCWEVASASHPLAGQFHFGRILPGGAIEIDRARWSALANHRVERLPRCQHCFAKYHCGGGCELAMSDPEYSRSFCQTTRAILEDKILNHLAPPAAGRSRCPDTGQMAAAMPAH